jgi:hypothetical protein
MLKRWDNFIGESNGGVKEICDRYGIKDWTLNPDGIYHTQ